MPPPPPDVPIVIQGTQSTQAQESEGSGKGKGAASTGLKVWGSRARRSAKKSKASQGFESLRLDAETRMVSSNVADECELVGSNRQVFEF